MARQKDGEEHLLAAVPPSVTPQRGKQGSLPDVGLLLRPVRDLRAPYITGAQGWGQGRLSLLRKSDQQGSDVAEGVQGLFGALLDVRRLLGVRGEREVGAEATVPTGSVLASKSSGGFGIAGGVEHLALLAIQHLTRQLGEFEGGGNPPACTTGRSPRRVASST